MFTDRINKKIAQKKIALKKTKRKNMQVENLI